MEGDNMKAPLYINRILVYPKLGRCDVTFRQGLNVIISEDVLNINEYNDNQDENNTGDYIFRDSVNSTGKTTLVHLIDYALGKSYFIANKCDGNEKLFIDTYAIAEIAIYGAKYTVKRSILDTDSIIIYCDWVAQFIIDKKPNLKILKQTSLEGYISFLEWEIFEGKNYFKDKPIVSYRSIMNYIIRDQFYGFSNYNSGLKIEQAELSRERLEFLFGLTTPKNLLLKEEISKLQSEKKVLNNELTVLKKYLSQILRRTPASIRKEIQTNESSISNLRIKLEEYNKEVAFSEREKDENREIKDKLEEQFKINLNDITVIKSRISNYNSTLHEIENELNKLQLINISMSMLNPFEYNKCPIFMNEIDSKSSSTQSCPLVDSQDEGNKNNEIIEARKKLLEYEKGDLERALIYLNEQLIASTKSYDLLKNAIDEVNLKIEDKSYAIISKRDSLRDEIKEFEYNNIALEHQISQHLYLDSLRKSKNEMQADIRLKRDELSKSSTSIIRLNEIYNEIVDFLSSSSRQGIIDDKTLEPFILFKSGQIDTGAGMRSIAIIAFDLTMLVFSLENKSNARYIPYLDLLIHDSPKRNDIYLVMYKRIFDFIIKLEETYLPIGTSFQYIITTLDASEKVLDNRDEYIRLALDNSGDGGKLFGNTIYI
jgi:hypothetical protein